MKVSTLAGSARSKSVRLSLSYLAVIMVLSLGFSTVLYFVSSSELNKQLEPPTGRRLHIPASGGQDGAFFNVNPSQLAGGAALELLQQQVAQSKRELVYELVLLNAGMLFVGVGLSYVLARRTLRPIELAMRAQSQFASNASHELRTPLAAMRVEIEDGLRTLRLSSSAKRLLESNLEELSHLTQLSEGLLRLAHEAEEVALMPVSADDITSRAMNRMVRSAQAKHIQIIDSVPTIVVLANDKSFLEVLVILLDNAIKYSPSETRVYIEGSCDKKNGYISVRDEGPGIVDKELTRIFDRFYRGNTHAAGHGLGLSIARTLTEAQHGELTAQNAPKKGAVFTIKLPLYGNK